MVIKSRWMRLTGGVLLLILLNIAAGYFYGRFDLTKEKRYTLSSRTREVLQQTKQNITITVFLDGEMPSSFKRLKNAVRDLLLDYKRFSKANIKLIYLDPLGGDITASAQEKIISDLDEIGIRPVSVNIKSDNGLAQKTIFPMALIEAGGRPMSVNLLQKAGGPATNYEDNITHSVQNLEYTFTSAIRSLLDGQIPRIGFTEGHGEPDNLHYYDAIMSLSQRFYVGRVDLGLIQKEGLDSLKMLVVANPETALTEAEKYKINYFVMKGGSVVWLLNQVQANLDELRNGEPKLATPHELNLNDMLFEYGARVNYNLITDLNAALIPVSSGSLGQGQMQLIPWVYYPVLVPDTTHQLVKNIDGVKAEFASTVDTIAVSGVKKTIVLRSSPYTRIVDVPRMLSLQLLQENPDLNAYHNGAKTAGVLLEGRFKSVFSGRPLPEGIEKDYNVPEKGSPAKMLVLGDGDLFTNQVSGTDKMPFPLGFDRYSQLNYGNKALLLNVADYFTADKPLISIRNKEIKTRLLDKVKLRTEKVKWQWLNLAFPLLLLILFAIFQHYYRKYKYAK